MRQNILLVLAVLLMITVTAIPAASIGDYVWNDLNKDGIQNDGETGINGVKVELFYESGACYMESNVCASRITAFGYGKNGFYVFEGAPIGNLYVKFNLPEGYAFSPKDQGNDDAIDSDADINTGKTDVFYHGTAGDLTRDAGMFRHAPAIEITKYTNGDDANIAPGPYIPVGSTVTWKYDVKNTGDVPLTNVGVTDNMIGEICFIGDLAVGETKSCTKTGTAVAGQYSNMGVTSGVYQNAVVTDIDPSNYFGTAPAIDITKYTNGDDANLPPGPSIPVGSTVTWKYDVKNTGNVPLTNVVVTDDKIGSICTIGDLAVGETKSCTKTGTAVAGQYSNMGTTSGTYDGKTVTDNDPSNYFGVSQGPGTGTPGYWKNHPEAWPVNSIEIGGQTYTKDQAIGIIDTSVSGDKTYTMFPALVAAKLNVLIGNPDSCIADTIISADAWMKDHPVGSQVKQTNSVWKTGEPLYISLNNYNNGLLCAPYMD